MAIENFMRGLACILFYAGFVCGIFNARAGAAQEKSTIERPLPQPGMGWSTYNYFVARHNQALFERMAEAFTASGLKDAGYTTLRIDGGWWGDDGNKRHWFWTEEGKYDGGAARQPGDPHVDPKNYPQGLKGLADKLHARGFKLGFYLSPSLSIGEPQNHVNNREPAAPAPVKGLQLIDQHARFVAESGVDHLFYDGYDWNKSKGLEPYERMSKALRREAVRAGRPIVFSINSGWSGKHPEWADEWRTSRDIDGKWNSILECLSSVADPGSAGKGHWNNPDYLMAGFCGDIEAQSQMSLWCVAAAPLYLAYDFRAMTPWDRYVLLNTEAIAVDQDDAGLPGRRVRQDQSSQVWSRELVDGGRAVVLLNTGNTPATLTVKWTELGLPAGAIHARDLWAHQDLGAIADGFTAADIPPHGCRFLKLAAGLERAPAPKNTWAPNPGKRPAHTPISPEGWKLKTDMRRELASDKLLDGNKTTGEWSAIQPGKWLEIDFGRTVAFNRLVIDMKGSGADVWPYRVYAPRTEVELQRSSDGAKYVPICRATLGPSYLLADFAETAARNLRIVFIECESTGAYPGETSWEVRDLYVFNTAAAAGK